MLISPYLSNLYRLGILVFSLGGLAASLYFVYLMLFVLQAICTYCMYSAIISLAIFTLSWIWLRKPETAAMEG